MTPFGSCPDHSPGFNVFITLQPLQCAPTLGDRNDDAKLHQQGLPLLIMKTQRCHTPAVCMQAAYKAAAAQAMTLGLAVSVGQ